DVAEAATRSLSPRLDRAPSRNRVPARARRAVRPAACERVRGRGARRAVRNRRRSRARVLLDEPRVGEEVAVRGDLARPFAAPLILASTSPQRVAILEQLRIPFDVVAPVFDERGDDPVEHAAGKARSVDGGDRPVLGVDTVVVCDGVVLGKPAGLSDAERMLELLSGRTHEVVSGLCLRTRAWEEVHREATRVSFRPLTPRDIAAYLTTGEWDA